MKKTAQILFILAFVGSLLAVPLAIFTLGKDNTTAYYENRALQTIPDYTAEELAEGAYSEDVELWLSDHIPLRETFLKATTWFDMYVLQQPSVNGIIVGDTLLPFNNFGEWDLGYLEPMAVEAVENHLPILDLLDQWDGTFLYVGIPLQNSYFGDEYPDYTASRDWHIEAMTELFEAETQAQGLPFLNMRDVFEAQGMPSAYYARTDHHYTYFGAYETYYATMETLNATGLDLPVLEESDITIEAVDGTFLGSRNREIYGLWDGEESFYMGVQTDPVPFTRYENGVEVAATLYTLPTGDNPITYDAYMGGDKAETWIQTNREDLPNLLIFGDSFTNPLETMLYTGFNETRSIDLRYYSAQGILSYIADYQPDVVLCIRDDHSYLLTVSNGEIAW